MQLRAGLVLGLIVFPSILGMVQAVAAAENWQQFFYWSGVNPADGAQFLFEPQYERWRIRWHYTQSGSPYNLTFYVYEKTADTYYMYETVPTEGNLEGQYVFTEPPPKQFKVELDLGNVGYLEFWGEQDLNSIPEFPSVFVLAACLVITTLVAVYFGRRFRGSQRQRGLKTVTEAVK